jgi:hypothetical protein
MATGTTGTIARFAAGETSASRPNVARTTGNVAACAASETPRLSASHAGTPPIRPIRALSGVAQAIRPAVASDDSWKPASEMSDGSTRSNRVTAQPSAAAARPARPDSRASRTTPAIAAARTTDGDAPENATYATIASIVSTDRRRRPSDPPSAPTAAATIAMFQPEIATTWLTPAAVKSAASSRSTRSRRPIRMPAARPASGSGSTLASAVAALRRTVSRAAAGSAGPGSISSERDKIVPATPVRSRYVPYGESSGGSGLPSTTIRWPGATTG